MGLMDAILAAGSTFDWISPAVAIVQDLTNGPGYTFALPRACERSARDIQKLLSKQHIPSWGLTIYQDSILITVHKPNAERAAQILRKTGF